MPKLDGFCSKLVCLITQNQVDQAKYFSHSQFNDKLITAFSKMEKQNRADKKRIMHHTCHTKEYPKKKSCILEARCCN